MNGLEDKWGLLNKWVDGWIIGKMSGWMNGLPDKWVDEWSSGQMSGWMNYWTKEWMYGLLHEWEDEWLLDKWMTCS